MMIQDDELQNPRWNICDLCQPKIGKVRDEGGDVSLTS